MRRILIDDRTGLFVDEKKLRNTRRWRLIAAILLTAVFSMLPDLHLERYMGMEYNRWFDVIQHSGYYCLLTLFLFYLLPSEKKDFSFLLSIFFISILFEFLQILVPGRNFSFVDIGSNLLGISTAFFLRHLHVSLKENQ